jgi:hypothetical protein
MFYPTLHRQQIYDIIAKNPFQTKLFTAVIVDNIYMFLKIFEELS